MLKVFLCGEGNNDLGTRWREPPGDDPGVIETLLRRVRLRGWNVERAVAWKSIRKYRAGASRNTPAHLDVRNVQGLVQLAYEAHCELLVFVRDHDGDEDRERAVRVAIETISDCDFEREYRYQLAIVDGLPRPSLEGWILCLLDVPGTDEMSQARAERELQTAGIEPKSTARYVELAETCGLPAGDSSLSTWLERVRVAFAALIDGAPA